MAKFHIDRSATGTFDEADLPTDAELDEFHAELVAVGDHLQEHLSTKFLHLILNRYLKQMRRSGNSRKAVAAELYNVVNWGIYHSVVREIEEPLGRLIDDPEEIPYGIPVEDGNGTERPADCGGLP